MKTCAGPLGEVGEQVELGGGEVHERRRRARRAAPRDRCATAPSATVPDVGAGRRSTRRSSAWTRATQLARAERLGEVVVGADRQADDEVGLGVAGGEHQDGDGSLALDLAAHVEAVEPGEHEVEHHEVGLELAGSAPRRRGRRRRWSTEKPSLRSRVATASAIDASSSTTRIVRGRAGAGADMRFQRKEPGLHVSCRSCGDSVQIDLDSFRSPVRHSNATEGKRALRPDRVRWHP